MSALSTKKSCEQAHPSESVRATKTVATSCLPTPAKQSTHVSSAKAHTRCLKLWFIGLGLFMGMGGTAVRAAEMAAFEIVAKEGRLLPARLEVPAGVKLKLTLRNEGKTPVEIENLELRVEKVLAPDAASVVTIQPLKAGSYLIVDEFHTETGTMLLIAK